MTIRVRRVYDRPASGDGVRILVDRLWPRGLTKAQTSVDAWAKELAPSTALRRWFAHNQEIAQKFNDDVAGNIAKAEENWPSIRNTAVADL